MGRRSTNSAVMICLFFLCQIMAPMALANDTDVPKTFATSSTELEDLKYISIEPSYELSNGWFSSEYSAGEITLLYRDASVVPIDNWIEWTGNRCFVWTICHHPPVPSTNRVEASIIATRN